MSIFLAFCLSSTFIVEGGCRRSLFFVHYFLNPSETSPDRKCRWSGGRTQNEEQRERKHLYLYTIQIILGSGQLGHSQTNCVLLLLMRSGEDRAGDERWCCVLGPLVSCHRWALLIIENWARSEEWMDIALHPIQHYQPPNMLQNHPSISKQTLGLFSSVPILNILVRSQLSWKVLLALFYLFNFLWGSAAMTAVLFQAAHHKILFSFRLQIIDTNNYVLKVWLNLGEVSVCSKLRQYWLLLGMAQLLTGIHIIHLIWHVTY